jgi:hypothetical protein
MCPERGEIRDKRPSYQRPQPPVDTHGSLRALSDPLRYLLPLPGKPRRLMTSRRLALPQECLGWPQGQSRGAEGAVRVGERHSADMG